MSKRCYILTLNTSGYGSPQHLHLAKELQVKGWQVRIYEPQEKARPFFEIDGFERIQVRGRAGFFLLLAKLVCLTRLPGECLVVSAWGHPLLWFLSTRARIAVYFLELTADVVPDRSSLAGRLKGWLWDRFRARVRWVLAPQEKRLEMAMQEYPQAQGMLVLNAPPLGMEAARVAHEGLRVLYTGQLGEEAQADKVLDLLTRSRDVAEFWVAGLVDEPWRARLAASGARQLGYLRGSELASLRAQCDVGLVSWGNTKPETRYAAPNKLFEYVAAGLAVLSFNNESLGAWNERWRFGYVAADAAQDVAECDAWLRSLDAQALRAQRQHNRSLQESELNYGRQVAPFLEALNE
jgi:hypothetical protein